MDAQNGGVRLKIEAWRVCSQCLLVRIILMRIRIRVPIEMKSWIGFILK